MTDRELMQQALEGLKKWSWGNDPRGANDYITVLRERLAQPEQEPFGYFQLDLRLDAWVQNRDSNKGVAFYTTPQPRQWQRLTDEAIWLEYQRFWPFHPAEEPTLAKDIAKFARAIEAKLRAKNGGGV